jgi:hypothetical protein
MSMKIVITTAAVLAALAGQALAQDFSHATESFAVRPAQRAAAPKSVLGAGFDNSARAAYGRSYDFEGWPTDYLTNRFGDRQAQGHL